VEKGIALFHKNYAGKEIGNRATLEQGMWYSVLTKRDKHMKAHVRIAVAFKVLIVVTMKSIIFWCVWCNI
jgi:hypothetical protein